MGLIVYGCRSEVVFLSQLDRIESRVGEICG